MNRYVCLSVVCTALYLGLSPAIFAAERARFHHVRLFAQPSDTTIFEIVQSKPILEGLWEEPNVR